MAQFTEYLLEYYDQNDNDKLKSKCLYCNQKWLGKIHSTKSQDHILSQLSGYKKSSNVSTCPGECPDDVIKRVKAFSEQRGTLKRSIAERKKNIVQHIQDNQGSILTGLEKMRDRAISHSASKTDNSIRTLDAHNKDCLDIAIADLIYSMGLSFSITESFYFKEVLRLASHVSTKYKPPPRKKISGSLLDVSYNNLQEKYDKILKKGAEKFGLTMYGDGATIHRMPLINILVSGVYERSAVLDIANCHRHLHAGGVKDAQYISNLFIPHFQRIDPEGVLFDLIYFDGAANVQLAGRFMAAKFPRLTVLHGSEHVVSLFFKAIAKEIPAIVNLIKVYRKIYGFFGSGSHHQPHSMFREASIEYFGYFVGMLRAADTRMAGYFISFTRFICLKDVLKNVVNSDKYENVIQKNNRLRNKMNSMKKIITDESFWRNITLLCRALIAPLRVLRLADKSEPGMHLLYYFFKKTNQSLREKRVELNNMVFSSSIYSVAEDHNFAEEGNKGNELSADEEEMDEFNEDDLQNLPVDVNNIGDCIIHYWNKQKKVSTRPRNCRLVAMPASQGL